jgi:predicted DNA-binding transcriptional regulator YafY
MTVRQRHDSIIRILRRKGTTTIAELTQEVGISRRTVLRDLSKLRDEGFVIHSEPGRGGGLQLDQRSVQTTVRLSVAEVFSLVISVSTVYALGGVPFTTLADTALAKIEKSLPSDKLNDLRRLLDCLYIGTLSQQVNLSNIRAVDTSLLPEFETAFLNQCPLKFRYQDVNGKKSQRLVEPQAMLILPPLWYLVAWDPSRQDFRHFRMDRISDPEVIEGENFLRRHVAFDQQVSPVRNFAHGYKSV